jgi:hypothetical protein
MAVDLTPATSLSSFLYDPFWEGSLPVRILFYFLLLFLFFKYKEHSLITIRYHVYHNIEYTYF